MNRMVKQSDEMNEPLLPALDSQAGLEARLLRLMELSLAQEQLNRCEQDSSFRPLSPQQLRSNALHELMLHAEEGYFEHMNSLVRRSAMYTASIVAFALGLMLLGGGSQQAEEQQRSLVYSTVPAKLQLGNPRNWNID